jgi:hypothetical protein
LPSQEGINRQKLSTLRPGMPLSALIDAFGTKWRDPQARDLGWVWGRDYGVHFDCRITTNNMLGEVSFLSKFPAKYGVEGLNVGMTFQGALAARADLTLDDSGTSPDRREYKALLQSGALLRAVFDNDALVGISIMDPHATYYEQYSRPLPDPSLYPAPEGSAGLPFKDTNLKLWVLNELQFAKAVRLGEPEDLVAHVEGRYVDLEAEGYEPRPAVLDYLARYPLGIDLLARVDALGADPASSIYRSIYYHWGGGSPDFDVTSLEGIGSCVNLKSLHLELMCADALDLAPLVDANSIEKIGLDLRRGRFANLNVLAQMPKLKEVIASAPEGNDGAVVAALKLKGVTVILPASRSSYSGPRLP